MGLSLILLDLRTRFGIAELDADCRMGIITFISAEASPSSDVFFSAFVFKMFLITISQEEDSGLTAVAFPPSSIKKK